MFTCGHLRKRECSIRRQFRLCSRARLFAHSCAFGDSEILSWYRLLPKRCLLHNTDTRESRVMKRMAMLRSTDEKPFLVGILIGARFVLFGSLKPCFCSRDWLNLVFEVDNITPWQPVNPSTLDVRPEQNRCPFQLVISVKRLQVAPWTQSTLWRTPSRTQFMSFRPKQYGPSSVFTAVGGTFGFIAWNQMQPNQRTQV